MSERPKLSYASQVIFLIYITGSIYSGPSEWNWAQVWRAWLWPMVLTAEIVPPIIERLAAEATTPAEPELSP